MTELTAERLRELLDYDPDTGVFTWKVRTSNRVNIGAVAGGINPDGYLLIGIGGMVFMSHRLAWLHQTGKWPAADIDHVNAQRDDNRWCNLREATRTQNNGNGRRYKNNTSGFKGVTWNIREQRYRAQIGINGKVRHLGRFTTPEAAHQAYCDAASQYFGEFARHN